MIFSCIKIIVHQSKAHNLRRFSKIGSKVIEYSYVFSQCRQTIHVLMGLLTVKIVKVDEPFSYQNEVE